MTADFYPLTISRLQQETDQAICMGFDLSEEQRQSFTFKPGQYLTLQTRIDGELLRRSYSICSAANDPQLRIAIKRVEGGIFSNYANEQLKVGDQLEVMPPQGQFYHTLNPAAAKRYMCLAVGSGITPILSIIQSVLETEPESRITLVYGNRRSNSVMFKEKLSFIKNRYLTRFNWVNILSQDDQGADILNGRIDNKKGYYLQKHKLINIHDTDEAFICGPEAMMSDVSRGFRLEGLSDSQIHYELFASSSEDSAQRISKAKQRVEQYGENKTSQVTVVADGRSSQFELATVGENILDAGLDHGMELPYSCKAGVCSTCKAKLIKGEVDMDIAHGLEAHEIEAGYILSCQSHPVSDEVFVDFDQR